jgi:trehalose 6-phosphate phosphatase
MKEMSGKILAQTKTDELPSAIDRVAEIKNGAAGKSHIVVFLDYDGTLTPIVNRPEDAVLSEHMRDVVQWLARQCMVAIISGRDLKDVRTRVGIQDIFYAGSHGFEIAGPGGWHEEYRDAKAFLPILDQTEEELHQALDDIPGLYIERKRYSIAVHYRRVAEQNRPEAERRTQIVQSRHRHKLRISSGKCVDDFQPKIDWHKGRALDWVLETASLKPEKVFPLYIGDDITDEDAFRAIRDRGVGIIVREKNRPTEARYALNSPSEVGDFLESFAAALSGYRW